MATIQPIEGGGGDSSLWPPTPGIEAHFRAEAARTWLDHALAGNVDLATGIAAALALLGSALVWPMARLAPFEEDSTEEDRPA